MSQGTMSEMPKYKCHKIVHALQITKVVHNPDESVDLFFEDSAFTSINVEDGYGKKHNPQVGGYYVVYKDGYKSFSPQKAFEDGYELVK